MPGISGKEERDWIMNRLKPLCGGRVWKTRVPDGVELERETASGVQPYLIVRFARPSAIQEGRNIATGEKGQPHMLTFSVIAICADADKLDPVMDRVEDLLVGERPSETASVIRAKGGFAYPYGDADSRPSRVALPTFMRVIINV